jgi:hypothetical protein
MSGLYSEDVVLWIVACITALDETGPLKLPAESPFTIEQALSDTLPA